MNYFNKEKITVFPTAYRQYTSGGETIVVNPEARLTTEYNVTNLVNGLIDQDINSGNFVVDYNNNIIKFCMQGYYFILNLTDYTEQNLYVKIRRENMGAGASGYENLLELIPIEYDSDDNANRNLDTDTQFIGLDYVTSATTGYFPLLIGGEVPDKSKLKFSLKDIGYEDNGVWKPISNTFATTNLSATNLTATNITNSGTINNLTLASNSKGFSVSGGTTSKTLDLKTNLNVGASSTYTGDVEVKSKKKLTIVGENSSASTLTFNGTSTFQSGDYDSDNATVGSEYIKVGGNTFNVVTRDTQQTISGQKTFSNIVNITSSSTSQEVLKVDGSVLACKSGNDYLLNIGNFGTNQYGLKFSGTNKHFCFNTNTQLAELRNGNGIVQLGSTTQDATSTSDGTFKVTGSISSNYRNYFSGLSLNDNYITMNNNTLTLGGNLTTNAYTGSTQNVILSTKSNKDFRLAGGGTVVFEGSCNFQKGIYGSNSLNETITIAGNTFNLSTRDSDQTINANKTLGSGKVLYLGTTNGNYNINSNGTISCNTLYVKDGSTTKCTINSSGQITAQSCYTPSDIRLKENIKPFENEKSILDLPIYTFDYIDGKKNNIGCIAQDLQELYPELVDTDENGYLNVAENKLVYLLIDEVKKLKEEIKKLSK